MEAVELKKDQHYKYQTTNDSYKVQYKGISLQYPGRHVFKILEGVSKGFNDILTEQSVNRFINKLP